MYYVISNDDLTVSRELDPMRAYVVRQVARYEIGGRLGKCPITHKMGMDYRTAVIIMDAEDTPILTVSPEGLASLREKEMRPGMWLASERRGSLPKAPKVKP